MSFTPQADFLPLPTSSAAPEEWLKWILQYSGKPFRYKAFGPGTFDCWGLVWHIYYHLGIDLPRFIEMPGKTVPQLVKACEAVLEEGHFETLEKPIHGCIVGMGKVGKGVLHHAGVYLAADGGAVIHIPFNSFVQIDSLDELKNNCTEIRYYAYRPALHQSI